MNVSRKVFINKQRFKNTLQLRKLTVSELSRRIYIPRETIKYCLQKEMIMPDTLETICKYLDVSPEYIQGKQTEKAPKWDQMDQVITFQLQKSGWVDDEDLPYLLKEVKERTDPEGNWIPHYWEKNIAEHLSVKQNEKEMIINLLVSNFSAPGSQYHRFSSDQYTRDYFEKHYEEITERISDVIAGYIIRHEE